LNLYHGEVGSLWTGIEEVALLVWTVLTLLGETSFSPSDLEVGPGTVIIKADQAKFRKIPRKIMI